MENSEIISKAINYIKSTYADGNISLDSVAYNAGFSTDYFNRIFASNTGFTVMEYVRFIRLRHASLLLRTTDKNILDIALECGYDSLEGFSRAFKSQYNKSPSDFREVMKGIEPVYGEFHNETLGTRLVHEFPEFKIADPDEVIDYLLEKDAVKYGYAVICIYINGEIPLYDGESLDDGFVLVWELNGRYEVEILSDDYDTVAKYCKKFSDSRFSTNLYNLDDTENVISELGKRGVKFTSVKSRYESVYRGEKFILNAPMGVSMRELKYSDFDSIKRFYTSFIRGENNPISLYLLHLEKELETRDLDGCDTHSVFLFGVYIDNKLIGIATGCLQRTHNFVINNCIEMNFIDDYKRDDLFEYAFKFVTNAVIDKGAVVYDDIQNGKYAEEHGNFTSLEMGYEVCVNCHEIER